MNKESMDVRKSKTPARLTLESLVANLESERQFDWTVRLRNNAKPKTESVVYGVLWFNGNTESRRVHFLDSKKQTRSLQEKINFDDAKQEFIKEVQRYLRDGYEIRLISNAGYEGCSAGFRFSV